MDNDESSIANPIDGNASPEEQLRQLRRLTDENEPLVDAALKELDTRFGTESKSNRKTPEAILAKAARPSILATKPWHTIRHVRDSFRFKTVLPDVTRLPEILEFLEANLGATILKRDVKKFLKPGAWGWRIAVFDLRMPNGQLVEYYLPVKEMEEAKKAGNHELFEKWRNRDLSRMSLAEYEQLKQAQKTSYDAYQRAFDNYLERSGNSLSDILASLTSVSVSSGEDI
jgi:hypothetical protein